LKLESNLGSEEAYRLLFDKFSKKRKRGWKVRSFREPSLIVVATGFPLPNRSSNLAGGLAKITIEAKGEESEISFSFDFRLWYFSHFVFESVVACLLFGVFLPKYLESQSLYAVLMMGIFSLGLLFIPWFSHECVKNTEAKIIAQSKAAFRKNKPQQST
jgi:hypothetical protein